MLFCSVIYQFGEFGQFMRFSNVVQENVMYNVADGESRLKAVSFQVMFCFTVGTVGVEFTSNISRSLRGVCSAAKARGEAQRWGLRVARESKNGSKMNKYHCVFFSFAHVLF